MSNQYADILPDDRRMERYSALAERFGIACGVLPLSAGLG
jgi:hypothetical protein